MVWWIFFGMVWNDMFIDLVWFSCEFLRNPSKSKMVCWRMLGYILGGFLMLS